MNPCNHINGVLIIYQAILITRGIQIPKIGLRHVTYVTREWPNRINDFLTDDSIVAIAADEKSDETIWFIKIRSQEVAASVIADDYQHTIAPEQAYLVANYFEKQHSSTKGTYYKLDAGRKAFVYRECVVYPFVQMDKIKPSIYFLPCHEYVDILGFIEANNLTSLDNLKVQ